MSLPEQVAKRIRDLRISKHITQEQLANSAGMDASMLARIENGRRPNIKLATLERIVEALGVSYRDFFTFADSKDDHDSIYALLNLIDDQSVLNSLHNIIEELSNEKR